MMGDSVHAQTTIRSNPNFAKTLIGDFTFDLEREQNRNRLFLQRNMTRVLAHHAKSRVRNANQEIRSSPRLAATVSESPAVQEVPKNGAADTLDMAARNLHSASRGISGAFDTSSSFTSGSASPATSMRKGINGDHKTPSRRSIRNLQMTQHQDQDAELSINISNIRKKLNFTSNLPPSDERPRKRVKREWIKCQCSLTIWDNRPGNGESERDREPEPIVRKNQMCQITAVDTGTNGFCVDVELDKDFVIRATDLRVAVQRKSESALEIIDNYFLEFKILPIKTEEEWPPVPILGKSDGDHFVGLEKTASERLQGALVARYMHLPQAPAKEVPLSVFFLHAGRTYRTKYGLEVSSVWAKPGVRAKIKQEEAEANPESWAVDDSGLVFGKEKPKSNRNTTHKSSVTTENDAKQVKLSYTFDAAPSKTAPKEFRRATLLGYCCPACPSVTNKNLQELQFHFLTLHHKYKLIIEKEHRDPLSDSITAIDFRVRPEDAPKPRHSSLGEDQTLLDWERPAVPLNLTAYVNGDRSWVGEAAPKKRGGTGAGSSSLIQDPVSSIRKQHDGYLPAEHVRDFRQPIRKKRPVVVLLRSTDDRTSSYTSLSHRRTGVSESPRSETDDEIDDEWFVQRHLEELELVADKEGWNDMKRELWKRWDRHRLEEKLEHPRYLSDSLIRFVRKHRDWLSIKDKTLQMALGQLLRNMMRTKVINEAVCADVYQMLFAEPAPSAAPINGNAAYQTTSSNSNATLNRHSRPPTVSASKAPSARPPPPTPPPSSTTRLQPFRNYIPTAPVVSEEVQKQKILNIPPNHCGQCTEPIVNMIREAVHCSDPTCDIPGVFFHLQCVKVGGKDRLDWTCWFCRERARLDKGKGKAVD